MSGTNTDTCLRVGGSGCDIDMIHSFTHRHVSSEKDKFLLLSMNRRSRPIFVRRAKTNKEKRFALFMIVEEFSKNRSTISDVLKAL
jgi:hypothetical protein